MGSFVLVFLGQDRPLVSPAARVLPRLQHRGPLFLGVRGAFGETPLTFLSREFLGLAE